MAKSQVVIITSNQHGKARKKGKKGRKIGKGVHKISHSKWGGYAALINHQSARRKKAMDERLCVECEVQFHSRAAFNRHDC